MPGPIAKRPRVGIIGGGQLARMLAESAYRLGLKPLLFVESEELPAALLAPERVIGKTSDAARLRKFFQAVDHVVFENEFLDTEILTKAARGLKTQFHPSLPAIGLLQDKIEQKKVLGHLGIACAPFLLAQEGEKAAGFVAKALAAFVGQAVLKWGRFGYDGKGVLILEDRKTPPERIAQFMSGAKKAGSAVYAETRVDFVRELAMIATYSVATGEFKAYPLVVSEQESGVCKKVHGPATSFGVAPALEQQASDAARKLAQELQLDGTFAIEFFEARSGDLLVNEIAPRVHNSGHYTQDAGATSQFENHWRAVLGLPLGETRPQGVFAMLNLLGPPGIELLDKDYRPPSPSEHLHLHWYSKSQIKPGRKLGHLNGRVETSVQMGDLFRELELCHDEWARRISLPSRPITKKKKKK